MTVEIVMPNLGFNAETATLLEWLKHPGDSIQKGEPITLVELEAFADGVLIEQPTPTGEVVPIGAIIGRIGE